MLTSDEEEERAAGESAVIRWRNDNTIIKATMPHDPRLHSNRKLYCKTNQRLEPATSWKLNPRSVILSDEDQSEIEYGNDNVFTYKVKSNTSSRIGSMHSSNYRLPAYSQRDYDKQSLRSSRRHSPMSVQSSHSMQSQACSYKLEKIEQLIAETIANGECSPQSILDMTQAVVGKNRYRENSRFISKPLHRRRYRYRRTESLRSRSIRDLGSEESSDISSEDDRYSVRSECVRNKSISRWNQSVAAPRTGPHSIHSIRMSSQPRNRYNQSISNGKYFSQNRTNTFMGNPIIEENVRSVKSMSIQTLNGRSSPISVDMDLRKLTCTEMITKYTTTNATNKAPTMSKKQSPTKAFSPIKKPLLIEKPVVSKDMQNISIENTETENCAHLRDNTKVTQHTTVHVNPKTLEEKTISREGTESAQDKGGPCEDVTASNHQKTTFVIPKIAPLKKKTTSKENTAPPKETNIDEKEKSVLSSDKFVLPKAKIGSPIKQMKSPTKISTSAAKMPPPPVPNVNKRLSDVSDLPEDRSDNSLKQSFIKRKLFTQTIGIALETEANSGNDSYSNSPETNIYRSCPRSRNKQNSLIPRPHVKKRLFNDVQSEPNFINLIHKIVPQEKMNATTGIVNRLGLRSSVHEVKSCDDISARPKMFNLNEETIFDVPEKETKAHVPTNIEKQNYNSKQHEIHEEKCVDLPKQAESNKESFESNRQSKLTKNINKYDTFCNLLSKPLNSNKDEPPPNNQISTTKNNGTISKSGKIVNIKENEQQKKTLKSNKDINLNNADCDVKNTKGNKSRGLIKVHNVLQESINQDRSTGPCDNTVKKTNKRMKRSATSELLSNNEGKKLKTSDIRQTKSNKNKNTPINRKTFRNKQTILDTPPAENEVRRSARKRMPPKRYSIFVNTLNGSKSNVNNDSLGSILTRSRSKGDTPVSNIQRKRERNLSPTFTVSDADLSPKKKVTKKQDSNVTNMPTRGRPKKNNTSSDIENVTTAESARKRGRPRNNNSYNAKSGSKMDAFWDDSEDEITFNTSRTRLKIPDKSSAGRVIKQNLGKNASKNSTPSESMPRRAPLRKLDHTANTSAVRSLDPANKKRTSPRLNRSASADNTITASKNSTPSESVPRRRPQRKLDHSVNTSADLSLNPVDKRQKSTRLNRSASADNTRTDPIPKVAAKLKKNPFFDESEDEVASNALHRTRLEIPDKSSGGGVKEQNLNNNKVLGQATAKPNNNITPKVQTTAVAKKNTFLDTDTELEEMTTQMRSGGTPQVKSTAGLFKVPAILAIRGSSNLESVIKRGRPKAPSVAGSPPKRRRSKKDTTLVPNERSRVNTVKITNSTLLFHQKMKSLMSSASDTDVTDEENNADTTISSFRERVKNFAQQNKLNSMLGSPTRSVKSTRSEMPHPLHSRSVKGRKDFLQNLSNIEPARNVSLMHNSTWKQPSLGLSDRSLGPRFIPGFSGTLKDTRNMSAFSDSRSVKSMGALGRSDPIPKVAAKLKKNPFFDESEDEVASNALHRTRLEIPDKSSGGGVKEQNLNNNKVLGQATAKPNNNITPKVQTTAVAKKNTFLDTDTELEEMTTQMRSGGTPQVKSTAGLFKVPAILAIRGSSNLESVIKRGRPKAPSVAGSPPKRRRSKKDTTLVPNERSRVNTVKITNSTLLFHQKMKSLMSSASDTDVTDEENNADTTISSFRERVKNFAQQNKLNSMLGSPTRSVKSTRSEMPHPLHSRSVKGRKDFLQNLSNIEPARNVSLMHNSTWKQPSLGLSDRSLGPRFIPGFSGTLKDTRNMSAFSDSRSVKSMGALGRSGKYNFLHFY